MSSLNDQQKAAVEETGRHLLIIAGPGTGKTRTLTERIQYLVGKLKSHEKILAVTFTNKAAGEMHERLVQLGVDLENKVELGTFHAFALRLLRRYKHLLEFPLNFSIASPDEIEALAGKFWPQRSKAERKALLKKISDWKSSLAAETDDGDVIGFRKFLRDNQLVDFEDILRDAVLLLREHPDVRQEVRSLYRHLLVDEYQDINAVQEALLKELVGSGVTLTVIGDPNQAIYGFRGSDVGYFQSFEEHFQPATILELSRNYRSCSNLLEASGQVVEKGRVFPVPALTAEIYAKGLLKVHEAPTDKAEAEYVAHTIEKLVGGTSHFSRDSGRVGREGATRSFGDIAVLYRLNIQGRNMAQALQRLGVPFQVSGDQTLELSPATRASLKRLPDGFALSEALQKLKADDKALADNWDAFLRLADRSKTAGDFLDALSLETPEDRFDPRAERINLMTLHAAKGLEFPVVFIIGCEDGILPLDLEFFLSDPDEERRLFYVGMTRAKEELYLVRARRRVLYGKSRELASSRFLSDIEEGLKAYEAAREKKFHRDPDRDQLKLF
jgi:DNA helicase II / ATP-dependent DNA helicase PcrA